MDAYAIVIGKDLSVNPTYVRPSEEMHRELIRLPFTRLFGENAGREMIASIPPDRLEGISDELVRQHTLGRRAS